MTDFNVTETAQKRIEYVRGQDKRETAFLRLEVRGGGCAGFEYSMKLDDTREDNDVAFGNETVVLDDMSLEILQGATLDFVTDLTGERFKLDIPNASSSCGCGTSFSL